MLWYEIWGPEEIYMHVCRILDIFHFPKYSVVQKKRKWKLLWLVSFIHKYTTIMYRLGNMCNKIEFLGCGPFHSIKDNNSTTQLSSSKSKQNTWHNIIEIWNRPSKLLFRWIMYVTYIKYIAPRCFASSCTFFLNCSQPRNIFQIYIYYLQHMVLPVETIMGA